MIRRLILSYVVVGILCGRKTGVSGNTAEVSDGGTVDMSKKPLLGDSYDPSTMSPTDPLHWSILEELFRNPSESLPNAWEVGPIYLPGSRESATQNTTLPSVHDSFNNQISSNDRFAHLFQLPDLAKVLSDPKLVQGTDYAVLKYIQRDGEEWSGKFPYEKIPLEHIEHLVNEREFSVVINALQRKWLPTAKMAKTLELETMCQGVSCNLYLTPPSGARGFECHLDWMDVVVVQVIGEKDWSVWTEPLIKMAVPDEKRKPTKSELGQGNPASVRLVPGDALYIPRGFMHNATTPVHSKSVSLHLTFGFEHNCATTMEALLHHSVALFVQEKQPTGALATAIPASLCAASPPTGTNSPTESGISLETLLHFAISAVVRRTHCGGFGEVEEPTRGNDNGAICNLRKSVALHPQFQQLKGRSEAEKKGQYVAGLKAIVNHLSVTDAVNLLNKVTGEPDPVANAGRYCYPHLSGFSVSQCDPNALPPATQTQLEEFATSFVEFARNRFTDAQQLMMKGLNEYHVERWK